MVQNNSFAFFEHKDFDIYIAIIVIKIGGLTSTKKSQGHRWPSEF